MVLYMIIILVTKLICIITLFHTFSLHKQKFQTLPGTFSVSMYPLVQQLTGMQVDSHIISVILLLLLRYTDLKLGCSGTICY